MLLLIQFAKLLFSNQGPIRYGFFAPHELDHQPFSIANPLLPSQNCSRVFRLLLYSESITLDSQQRATP